MNFTLTFRHSYLDIVKWTGFIGLLASLFVGTGEFLLHYSNAGYQFDVPYQMFEHVSETRLNIGHLLVVIGMPLYIVGYFHLFLALRIEKQTPALLFFCIGIVSFIIGGMWISSRAFMAYIYKIVYSPDQLDMYLQIVDRYKFLIEKLVESLRYLVLFNSVLFVFIILKYKTLYSRHMALFNPVLWLAIVFLLFFTLPIIGNYLAPTAMNFAHLVLFSASLIIINYKNKTNEKGIDHPI